MYYICISRTTSFNFSLFFASPHKVSGLSVEIHSQAGFILYAGQRLRLRLRQSRPHRKFSHYNRATMTMMMMMWIAWILGLSGVRCAVTIKTAKSILSSSPSWNRNSQSESVYVLGQSRGMLVIYLYLQLSLLPVRWANFLIFMCVECAIYVIVRINRRLLWSAVSALV